MRSFVPAIYDVTVAIPKSSPAPTMLRLLQGKPSVVSFRNQFVFDTFLILSLPIFYYVQTHHILT
jgi:hypothetical protein